MKILLIDDDATSIKRLTCLLEALNHICKAFTVPQQAIDEYRHSSYDVVITDMLMPEINGLEVLRHVRSINPKAKAIIVTGQIDIEIVMDDPSIIVSAIPVLPSLLQMRTGMIRALLCLLSYASP
jgi:CheY-like chemotaxis protein